MCNMLSKIYFKTRCFPPPPPRILGSTRYIIYPWLQAWSYLETENTSTTPHKGRRSIETEKGGGSQPNLIREGGTQRRAEARASCASSVHASPPHPPPPPSFSMTRRSRSPTLVHPVYLPLFSDTVVSGGKEYQHDADWPHAEAGRRYSELSRQYKSAVWGRHHAAHHPAVRRLRHALPGLASLQVRQLASILSLRMCKMLSRWLI